MTALLAPAPSDARTQAMRDLTAALAKPDAAERVGFELWDRVRPIAGSSLRLATRLIRFAGQDAAAQLDNDQCARAAVCIARASWADLTAAEIDQCLRSAIVREVVRTKSKSKGAAT
jgi:hypothetical protein